MEREIFERILEQLSGIERRLAALEGEEKDHPHERHGHEGHGHAHRGHAHHGRDRAEDEPRGRDRSDGGQRFDEKRVVDLIVDLVEERLVRVLDRSHRRAGGGDLHRGDGCRHCGQMPYRPDRR